VSGNRAAVGRTQVRHHRGDATKMARTKANERLGKWILNRHTGTKLARANKWHRRKSENSPPVNPFQAASYVTSASVIKNLKIFLDNSKDRRTIIYMVRYMFGNERIDYECVNAA